MSAFSDRLFRARRSRCLRVFAVVFAALVSLPVVGAGRTGRVLILHTNDLHDHLRPGYDGRGGLPYVSGYIRSVRAERDDVLVLDGGDVTEKGDLVAFRANYEMTYEAMRRIGYHGVAIGNHDYDDVLVPGVRRYERILGQPMLCLNIVKEDGFPQFLPSRLVTIGGVRVALIGLIVPRKENCLDAEASGGALAREAERLDREAHLVVVVCHEGESTCRQWSRQAPAVDIFVSGHSHQALLEPVVVPETGARIVQAGSYARWVGRLEVELELETERILQARGELVPMLHDRVPVDSEMLEWVRRRERELCPEATEVVVPYNPAIVDRFSVARLAADALKRATGAEVGFCNPYQIIRDTLPAGPVDVNALFLTGGQRGHDNVIAHLTGAEIEAYVNALVRFNRERAQWSGFRVRGAPDPAGGQQMAVDLDAARTYKVVIAELEWRTRFLRMVDRIREANLGGPLASREFAATPIDVTFTGALKEYVVALVREGTTLHVRSEELAAAQEL